jgi:hypothetical protein
VAVSIGPRIQVDGEEEYRRKINEIITQSKTLDAEMKALTATFDKESTEQEKATKSSKLLNDQLATARERTKLVRDMTEQSTAKTGENSTQTLKWKEQLAKAKTELHNMEQQAGDAAKGVGKLGDEEENAGRKTSVFGDMLKANLCSDLIRKGIEATASIVKDLAKGMVDAVKETAAYADEINTLAKTTGMSTDAIQEWRYAADLIDVSFETIEGSLTKLTQSMDSARDGSSKQAQAFKDLGVEVTDANGNLRDSSEVFMDVLDALRKIENPTERDAAAMDVLGKSAKDLNPLIETSASDLADLRKEAHKVGAVMDKDTLDSMNEVQDAIDRVSGTWEGLKRTLGAAIGIKILPDLEKFVGLFQDLAKTGNVSEFIDKLIRQLTKERNWSQAGEKIGDLLGRLLGNAPRIIVAGVKLAGGLIKGLIQGIPKMGEAIIEEFRKLKLSDATRDMIYDMQNVRAEIEKIPGAADRMASSLGEVNGHQKEAEHWIEIFDELSKKTDPTAQETERLETAVKKLNELYPELGLKLDTDTGKWSLNTEEIRRNIDALSDKYRAEAYYSAAGETLTDIAKLEAESQVYRDQLDLLTAQKSAIDRLAESKEAQIQTIYALREAYGRGTITLTEYYDTLTEMSGTAITGYQSEQAYITDTKNALHGIYDQQLNINARYEEAVKTVGAYDEKIADLNKDVEFYWSKAGEYSDAAAEKVGSSFDQVEKIIDKRKDATFKRAQLIGKAIDDGTAAGIDQNAYKITSAAEKAVQGAINAMRRTAEIRSPSKVTRDLIGKNLALGVVTGYEEIMQQALSRQVFSMTPVFDEMTAGGTVTNNNTTTNVGGVSVNVYARDGESTNEIAEKVMRKIQTATDARKAVFA